MLKRIGVLLLLGLLLLARPAGAAPPGQEGDGQAYTVRAGDTLGGLAYNFYGDFSLWPAIIQATNRRAAADSRLTPVGDPNNLAEGQTLWIPGRTEAEQLLGLAARPIAPLDEALLGELDRYVEASRQRYGIPGAAVAVVTGQEVVFAKGYGVRALGQPEPVTPETLFAVGSTTKAMNSLLIATLVDDGLLDWDQPVAEIWPGFTLEDPAVAAELPLRRLLDMSSGLARRDLAWSGVGLTAEEMMASLADLPLLGPPGGRYRYNNQAVATAGYVAALAAGGEVGHLGEAYAGLLRERVFDPMGMTGARLAPPTDGDFALPHDFTLGGQAVPTYYHTDPGLMPAGSGVASVLDMARFVQVQLNEGVTPEGVRVVSAENLAETWQPATRVTDSLSYGMGWFVDNYQGVKIIWHDGDVLGFKAQIGFMPEVGVGFVVLTNRMLSTGFSYGVRYRLAELLYGLESQGGPPFEAQWDAFIPAIAGLRAGVSPTVDPAAVTPYLGSYSGRWQVELEPDNTLWVVRGPYRWHLLAHTRPPETLDRDMPPLTPGVPHVQYMIENGFGIAAPLFFELDPTGPITMTFKLGSGEVGSYGKE